MLIPYAGKESEDYEPRGYTRGPNWECSPRQDEMLSYLQGLAPMGESFEVPCEWLKQDLGFKTHTAICNIMSRLIRRGLVRRLAVGNKQSTGVLVVVKRFEELPIPSR